MALDIPINIKSRYWLKGDYDIDEQGVNGFMANDGGGTVLYKNINAPTYACRFCVKQVSQTHNVGHEYTYRLANGDDPDGYYENPRQATSTYLQQDPNHGINWTWLNQFNWNPPDDDCSTSCDGGCYNSCWGSTVGDGCYDCVSCASNCLTTCNTQSVTCTNCYPCHNCYNSCTNCASCTASCASSGT